MLTIDDVVAIPLFSALPAVDLERLARTSADLHLSSGEFAVHEGGEGALFVVLTGKIEVVKTLEQGSNVGSAGESRARSLVVPLALGTPFPGGYRAVEPSRVMRVDVQQYYAIAAVSKDISQKVSALARERIGGLQSITAEPQKPRVTLIGHRWDTACGNLRRFLARNQISFNWLTPDAPELSTYWPGTRPPADDVFPWYSPDGAVIERRSARSRRSPRPADPRTRCGIRCRHCRRWAGWPLRTPSTAHPRTAHDRCRA
jgi:thioredoxin reductase (NADPH)